MELWDGYYEDETLAGKDLVRGQAIPKGLYHIVCDVLVYHEDGEYLLMQRDWKKETYPGMYESSAGGSVLKGETPLEAAKRELEEETGIIAENLEFLFRKVSEKSCAIHYGYLCKTNQRKDSVCLQKGETISYRWLEKEDFLKFINTDEYVPSGRERFKEYFDSIK
ncbi:MAG: NUDIX domain-containing protein [Lachnospiraceae bacterium]|nr:NUDIX domain-containing protein [Lachnospiraceae bacterium]